MSKLGYLRTPAVLIAAAALVAAEPGRESGALYAAQVSASEAVDVTRADVAKSNEKIAMAHAALREMWTANFRKLGARFAVPGLIRYRGRTSSVCGIMGRGNAGYCPGDNTIYFDEIFVAAQARRAADELGSDGDMAAVGIIAHEMGHAVAIQLGYHSRVTYANESTADCLAGAFTKQAQRDGSLEEGDLDEAFFGMAAAGDPTPELTGDRRIDRRILRAAALMGHGTREQRMANFRQGLEGGAGACLDDFQSLS